MAEDLLHEAVADRDRARHCEMGENVPHEPKHPERTWSAAIELCHCTNEPCCLIEDVEQVDDGTRADGGDD
jgi:hypothetical protein